ncbi:MAG: hypothetical protein FJW26_05715 [Acidimicrobiia bacterium]|nr:hypothetical protein [Acidimicrobiia bacterium]
MQKAAVTVFKQRIESQEHRCLCGSLLARIIPEGIELKCRKCKRLRIIPKSRITQSVKTDLAED